MTIEEIRAISMSPEFIKSLKDRGTYEAWLRTDDKTKEEALIVIARHFKLNGNL